MSSDPYPAIETWSIPEEALASTQSAVRPFGQGGLEAGVFWLGHRVPHSVVEAVVHPTGPGVEEQPDQWRVGAEVFGSVSRWAEPRGFALLGIVHTHGGSGVPRLSPADRTRSVRAPGVLAVVVGSWGAEEDPQAWGWYVHDGIDYRLLPPTERSMRIAVRPDLRTETWEADRFGVPRTTP